MDREHTKSELEAEKTDIDTRIATLQTKDGADAFIAAQKAGIDTVLPTLKDRKLPHNQISMKQFLGLQKRIIERDPAAYVTREIARLERCAVELEHEFDLGESEVRQ